MMEDGKIENLKARGIGKSPLLSGNHHSSLSTFSLGERVCREVGNEAGTYR
jgi:hypothetical protein